MYQSEHINELAAALAVAQGSFPVLEKKSRAYNYNYADLAETLQAIQDIMKANGLCLVHQIISRDGCETLVTKLFHCSGQYIGTEIPLIHSSSDKINGMQALGSAITYAKRYAIGCLLNLAADKEIDDDGHKSSPKPVKPEERVYPPKFRQGGMKPDEARVISQYLSKYPERKKPLFDKYSVNDVADIPANQFDHLVKTFQGLEAVNV